jgi:hypothetical protein
MTTNDALFLTAGERTSLLNDLTTYVYASTIQAEFPKKYYFKSFQDYIAYLKRKNNK